MKGDSCVSAMLKKCSLIVLPLIALSVSACGTTQPPARIYHATAKKPATETKLIADKDCNLAPAKAQSGPAIGAVGAVVAGQVVTAAVTSLGEALKAAGEEHTFEVKALNPLVVKSTERFPCLYLIKGKFHTDLDLGQKATSDSIDLKNFSVLKPVLDQTNSWLSEKPDLIIGLIPKFEGKALTFGLGYLWYAKSISTAWSGNDNNLSYLELSLRPPNIPHNDPKALAVQLPLGHIEPGALYIPPADISTGDNDPITLRTPWMTIDQAAVSGSDLIVTADVRFLETSPANPALTILGTALTNSATSTGTIVKDALDPVTRASAEQTVYQTEKQQLVDYTKAWADAERAIKDCLASSNDDRKEKSIAANGAQLLANLIAGRAGAQTPYDAKTIVSPTAGTCKPA
mgnify:CR=1 FL=1